MKTTFFSSIILGCILNFLLDTQNVYGQNQDTIAPLINSLGDTIKTGVSIPIAGRYIDPNSGAKPRVIALGSPKNVKVTTNHHSVASNLTRTEVDIKNQAIVQIGSDKSSFVLMNSQGDSIPSGIALPVQGKRVNSHPPLPVRADPLRMKDHATADIRFLDVDQGMNSSYSRSLIEDAKGRLWIGTYRGGVTQYDGREFRHFTTESGLSHNVVLALIEDRVGNIWMGTGGGGICRYDGESFTHFTEQEGLSNNIVLTIWEDKKGHLWFGTLESGITKYDGQTFTHYTIKEGLSHNSVRSISEDERGNLWIGTWGGGVCHFDGERFIHFTEREGLTSNLIWCTFHDSRGNLWIGSDNGLNRFDGTYITQFGTKDGLPSAKIRTLHESSDGALWIGTEAGAVKFDGLTFTHYTESEGMSSNRIRAIHEDKNGNLWFATEGGGLNYFQRNSFSHLTENEGLSHNRIRAIIEDKQGDLWFGTDGQGISHYDGHYLIHYTEKEGLSNNTVWTMHQDRNGNLWVGTDQGGVSRFDGKSFLHYTVSEGLSNNIVRDILEDKYGNIWFATWGGGVCYFAPTGNDGLGSFTHFTEKEGLANNIVRTIYQDEYGNIWCGTDGGGVSRLNRNPDSLERHQAGWTSVTHLTTREGLSHNHITSIIGDSKGHFWIGTNGGGLNRFDPFANEGKGIITQYSEKEGLSNDIIWSILPDHNGNIWVGTEKGMNHLVFEVEQSEPPTTILKPAISTEIMTISIFDYSDGLKAIDFNHNSALIDQKNRAWWGTGKSLVTLDLNNQVSITTPPTVQLSRLDIDGSYVDFRNLSDKVSQNISIDGVQSHDQLPMNLKLSHSLNHVTFHFVAIDWSAPDKIEYIYRLKGLAEDWSPPSSDGKVEYRNLPSGHHTFEVRAMGESQVWGDILGYDFIIHPPWWWSRSAYLFYALCSIGLIYLVDRIQRQRVVKKEREKSREKELLQAKEIEKAYHQLKSTQAQLIQSEKMASLGELTAGIAHEIQNPLNFVNNFSDINAELIDEMEAEIIKGDLSEIKALAINIRDNEQKIIHHGKRADSIVKSMLLHSRTNPAGRELTDINSVVEEYLRLAYHGMRAKDKSFNATTETSFDDSIGKINVIPQDIGRLILNLITNAFYAIDEQKKKGKASYGPSVSISTKKENDQVIIKISDNGTGISKDKINKIFQPFFTTKPTGQGTGLGLSLSYDIVKAHGGELTVESKQGIGTTFLISIPFYETNEHE